MKIVFEDQLKFAGGLSYCLATSFLYYVTFVQFGLMHYLEQELKMEAIPLFALVGSLALSGIIGGILAGTIIDRYRSQLRTLLATIGVCSVFSFGFAILIFQLVQLSWLYFITAALGLNLGVLIVTLLFVFNRYLHFRIRGIFAGLAAGTAYLAANVLVATVENPAMIGTVNACAIGSNLLILVLIWDSISIAKPQPAINTSFRPAAFIAAISPLLLMIFLDTYCFYPVGQESFGPYPVLLLPEHWIKNGIWHMLLAFTAGLFAFSIGNRRLIQLGFISLAVAAVLLVANYYSPLRALIYPVYSLQVSVYTIALFSMWGNLLPESKTGLWLGIGMAICGWLGSGAGIATSMIGMRLLPFPYFFVPVVVISLLGLLLVRKRNLFCDYAEQIEEDIS